eukprot:gene8954-530_t
MNASNAVVAARRSTTRAQLPSPPTIICDFSDALPICPHIARPLQHAELDGSAAKTSLGSAPGSLSSTTQRAAQRR